MLEKLGIEVMKVTDDEIHARCPMAARDHAGGQDRHPSWSLNRVTGLHACWSCGYRGYFRTLVADVLGLDDWDSARWVRVESAKSGVEFLLAQLDSEEGFEEPYKPVFVPSMLALYTSPPASALDQREITREHCTNYGLMWDHDSEAWIIPISDPDGERVGYQLKNSKFYRNIPRGLTKGVFGLERVQPGERVLLVESPLDVVYLAGLDIRAVSTYGAAYATHQMQALRERTSRVVLALDDDATGREMTTSLLQDWAPRFNFSVFVYPDPPKGKDPGELLRPDIMDGIARARLPFFTGF